MPEHSSKHPATQSRESETGSSLLDYLSRGARHEKLASSDFVLSLSESSRPHPAAAGRDQLLQDMENL